MQVVTGTVVDGKVVVKDVELEEGSTVTVVARDDDEAFELSPQQEQDLADSITEIEQGNFVEADEVLKRLRR